MVLTAIIYIAHVVSIDSLEQNAKKTSKEIKLLKRPTDELRNIPSRLSQRKTC